MLNVLDSEVLQAECLHMGEAALLVADRLLFTTSILQILLSPSKSMDLLMPMLYTTLAPKTQKIKINIWWA